MRRILFLLFFSTLVNAPLRGEDFRSVYHKGVEALEAGRYDEAIDAFQTIILASPTNAPIYDLLGMAYMSKSDSDDLALEAFEKAIEIDPHYANAFYNIGSMYMSQENQTELAREYFGKAVQFDPSHVRAHFGLGWIKLMVDHVPHQAVTEFQRTLELSPDFAEAHYGLGLAYLQGNKSAMALGPISTLRALNREELAAKIESLMKSGEAVPTEVPEELTKGEVNADPHAPSV